MTKTQISLLRENSSILASKIRELCENKIAENLRLANEQNAKKFECLLTYVKDSTDTLVDKLLADRDRLAARIDEIKTSIETSKQAQESLLKSRNEFSKVRFSQILFPPKNIENFPVRRFFVKSSIFDRQNTTKILCITPNSLFSYFLE